MLSLCSGGIAASKEGVSDSEASESSDSDGSMIAAFEVDFYIGDTPVTLQLLIDRVSGK